MNSSADLTQQIEDSMNEVRQLKISYAPKEELNSAIIHFIELNVMKDNQYRTTIEASIEKYMKDAENKICLLKSERAEQKDVLNAVCEYLILKRIKKTRQSKETFKKSVLDQKISDMQDKLYKLQQEKAPEDKIRNVVRSVIELKQAEDSNYVVNIKASIDKYLSGAADNVHALKKLVAPQEKVKEAVFEYIMIKHIKDFMM